MNHCSLIFGIQRFWVEVVVDRRVGAVRAAILLAIFVRDRIRSGGVLSGWIRSSDFRFLFLFLCSNQVWLILE